MKIKDRELIPRDIPEIPIMEPNAFYAGKKVETSYKEYAVIIGEDNSIHLKEIYRLPLKRFVYLLANMKVY